MYNKDVSIMNFTVVHFSPFVMLQIHHHNEEVSLVMGFLLRDSTYIKTTGFLCDPSSPSFRVLVNTIVIDILIIIAIVFIITVVILIISIASSTINIFFTFYNPANTLVVK